MGPELLGVLLLLGLVLAGSRQWVSLPLGLFLGVVWLVASGLLPISLVPLAAVVGLAQCALWIELGTLLQSRRVQPPAFLRDVSVSGFLGGTLGGFGLWYGTEISGAPLALGFLGSLFACLVRGGGIRGGLAATVLLPVRTDPASQSVPIFFLLSVALGAVPR